MLRSMLASHPTIDHVFHALGDPTRRAIVVHLGRGPASVSELAAPLPISLAATVQHVQVLEASGLVATHKRGRVRTCRLEPYALLEAERWLAQRRALWEGRLDRLEALMHARTPNTDTADPDTPNPGTSNEEEPT